MPQILRIQRHISILPQSKTKQKENWKLDVSFISYKKESLKLWSDHKKISLEKKNPKWTTENQQVRTDVFQTRDSISFVSYTAWYPHFYMELQPIARSKFNELAY